MPHYIVRSGLSRRLIEADSEEGARLQFIQDRPLRGHIPALDEFIEIWPARPLEIAEFQRKQRVPRMDGQTALDLGLPKIHDAKRKHFAKKKDHA